MADEAKAVLIATIGAVGRRARAGAGPRGGLLAGKTIDMIVGTGPGGGFDTYARTLARHMSRHIPGHPRSSSRTCREPAAPRPLPSSIRCAEGRHQSSARCFRARSWSRCSATRPQAPYDPTKLQYVGTADNGTRICFTWHTSQTKTFEDALRRKTVIGASAAGGSSRDYAFMHNKLNGAQFDVVSGYAGGAEILLALERGEIDGTCGFEWSSLKTQRPDWLRDKKVHILVQVALEPEPTLTQMGVPRITGFTNTEEDRKAMELIIGQQVFGRPYILPPDTPAEQVKTDPRRLHEDDGRRGIPRRRGALAPRHRADRRREGAGAGRGPLFRAGRGRRKGEGRGEAVINGAAEIAGDSVAASRFDRSRGKFVIQSPLTSPGEIAS